jgi:hypothetical protein
MKDEPELRDIFAMFAMMGLIMKYGNLREDGIAKSAFVYADAMMWQRQNGEASVNTGRADGSHRGSQENHS